MIDDSRRYIAALAHDPGFLALCEQMTAEVDAMTEDLQDEQDAQAALRKLRVWQVTRRIVNVLRSTPEAVEETIRIEEDRQLNETLPFFGREEDPFSRRAPVPPPISR